MAWAVEKRNNGKLMRGGKKTRKKFKRWWFTGRHGCCDDVKIKGKGEILDKDGYTWEENAREEARWEKKDEMRMEKKGPHEVRDKMKDWETMKKITIMKRNVRN